MSRGYDVWIYDQLNPDEKNRGVGKRERPSHSFLKPLPAHLVGRGPKKIISNNKNKEDDSSARTKNR